MSRSALRIACSLGLVALGVTLGLTCRDYTLTRFGRDTGLPLSYVGWFLAGFGELGLIGINIFAGGPLDKRRD